MFNFKDAFIYIFKEKSWGYKFALPIVLYLVMILPTVVLTFLEPTTPTYVNNFNTTRRSMSSYDMTALIASGIMLIGMIPYIIVSLWYMYENTQSGIFNRSTVAIWRNPFKDTLKKVTKYGIVSSVYSLITFTALLLIIGVMAGIFIAGLLVFSAASGGARPDNFLVFLTSGLGLFLICFFGIIFLIITTLVFLWTTSGSLRLFATNTISEGLKLEENWKIAWRHKSKFIAIFAFLMIFTMVLSFLGGIGGAITGVLTMALPLVGLLSNIVFQIVLGVITVYATSFIYPRLLGQMYRQVIKEEEALKNITL